MYMIDMLRIANNTVLCIILFLFLNGCQDFSEQHNESYSWKSSLNSSVADSSIVDSPDKEDKLIERRILSKNENFDFTIPIQDGKFLPPSISTDELITFTRQLTSSLQGVLLDMENFDDDPIKTVYNDRPELFPYFKDKVIRYKIIDYDNMHIIVDVYDEFETEIFARDASFTPTNVDYVMPHRKRAI